MEHPFLIIQVHDIGLNNTSIPKKRFHIRDFVCNTWKRWFNLNGHRIRILPGLFLCLRCLKHDNDGSSFSKLVTLFHDNNWLAELCGCSSTIAYELHHSCLASVDVHLFRSVQKLGAMCVELSSNIGVLLMQLMDDLTLGTAERRLVVLFVQSSCEFCAQDAQPMFRFSQKNAQLKLSGSYFFLQLSGSTVSS